MSKMGGLGQLVSLKVTENSTNRLDRAHTSSY